MWQRYNKKIKLYIYKLIVDHATPKMGFSLTIPGGAGRGAATDNM